MRPLWVRIPPSAPRRRQEERAQPSEGRVCEFESRRRLFFLPSLSSGEDARLSTGFRRVRSSSGGLDWLRTPTAEGARPERVKCRFESDRSYHARVSQPAEDAGSDPVCCRCKSCPWHHARVAQQQEAADSKPVQCWCNSSRAHSKTCIRVAKLATRTAVNRLIAGSNPAPGAGRVAQRTVQPLYKRPTRGSTPPAPTTVANPSLVGTSRRLMVISWVVQSGETAALKTAPVRVRIPPREHFISGGSPAKTRWL